MKLREDVHDKKLDLGLIVLVREVRFLRGLLGARLSKRARYGGGSWRP